jgi:hypothetical protein
METLAQATFLPPTCFSARLVSASWLVAFVHFVRGPGIIISDHLGGFTAKEGLFMFANQGLEGIVLRTRPQQLKFAIVGREAHSARPKRPRPSSTLPNATYGPRQLMSAVGSRTDSMRTSPFGLFMTRSDH